MLPTASAVGCRAVAASQPSTNEPTPGFLLPIEAPIRYLAAQMLKKVAFTVYPVTDVDRARSFYEDVLGLEVGANGGHEGKFWVEYDLPGGGCLAISNATPDAPSASSGGTIAFEVEDLDDLVSRLKARAVPILADTIRGPNCRMVPCTDPDGNSIILHQLDNSAD